MIGGALQAEISASRFEKRMASVWSYLTLSNCVVKAAVHGGCPLTESVELYLLEEGLHRQ